MMRAHQQFWRKAGCGVLSMLLSTGLASGAWAQTPTKAAVTASPPVPVAATDTAHLVRLSTPGGVRFIFHTRGTGPLPQTGSRVTMRYTGFLPDGHIFDASEAQGGLLKFRVGQHEVIAGLDELLPLLPVGSRVRAWIPARLAYAAKGVPNPDDETKFIVPPDTELVFELELLGIR